MPLLETRGLTRSPWFEGLDLALNEGEIVCLRGPSGAGKSLLLRSLADLDPVDSGDVLLEDRTRSAFTPQLWRRNVLYVHQRAIVLPGSVQENLTRVGAIGGIALDPVPGLESDADAERLSGGEAQRLALHRALALNPKVLLLDEITGAMDLELAGTWEARIRKHVDQGNAALWVTHEDALVERLGAREVRPW